MQSGVNKSTFEVSHELQHEKKMTKSHKIFDGIFKSFTERFRTQWGLSMVEKMWSIEFLA